MLRGNLHEYANSHLLFEEQGYFGAGIAQRNLYYWTADSATDVKTYYEGIFPFFVEGNSERQWLITGFNVDGSKPDNSGKSQFLGLGSFCDYKQPYYCAALALVNVDQPNLIDLPVLSPKMFRYLTPPPNFMSIPKRGTLIIYSYYISVG
jgi:hypothetical protein